MSSSIPLALRAVEVGRRGSIKAAAEACAPGAVSQQVRLLEDRLGVALSRASARACG